MYEGPRRDWEFEECSLAHGRGLVRGGLHPGSVVVISQSFVL